MQIPEYVVYHMHSMLSNGTTDLDSVTNFRDYVKAAQECGMKALAFSEHGNLYEWLHKKEAVEAAGMKYIHAVEAYITEDCPGKSALYRARSIPDEKNDRGEYVWFTKYMQDSDGRWVCQKVAEPQAKKKKNEEEEEYPEETQEELQEEEIQYAFFQRDTMKQVDWKKNRDNYHCVLIAKNYDGVKELNKMVSVSANRKDYHFYYAPRITTDELFTTSDNIIITSACLGGIVAKTKGESRERILSFMEKNKHRCYLELQHHNCEDQIELNKMLYEIHKNTGIPLIVGTDTHALNAFHMEVRAIEKKAKKSKFSNEDEFDLTFKTKEELWNAYEQQNALPMPVIAEAMQNSVRMAESVKEFSIDRTAKYPKLYDDSEAVFKQKINEGVKHRGINKYPNYQTYKDRIQYEYETYKHNNAIDFMLLEEDYKSEMRRRGIKFGYSRGSVSGSIIAYLLGITEVDSVKYNLNFERFMNRERISLADIDTDWLSEDREEVKKYLFSKPGLYCCDIVTFNTIALKGAIDDVCRALYKTEYPEELQRKIIEDKAKYRKILADTKKEMNEHDKGYLKIADEIKNLAETDEEKARKKHPDVFKYVDFLIGTIVSVGNHPAGCVVSPFPVDEWFGTFESKGDEYPISMLNMKEIDSLNFVKLDILGLDNIGLIYKTCELAGIPFLTPDNTPPDDIDVWNSIRDDTTMIFQWESASATAYLRQLFSDSTIAKIREQNPNFTYMDLFSIGNGAIRPAGESYRDKLAQGIYQDNGHKALNDFLAPTLDYLVYQEQVIEFLHSFCGYTMGEADLVRRGFAKKTGTEQYIPTIKSGFYQTMKEKYNVPQEESETLVTNFLQVIEDASSYLFSKNHADPYSWIGYICGYLRYHYPLEFITTALNIFEGKEDKSVAIINYAKKKGIRISSIKFRHSLSKYSFDKETNQIFKGLTSIKYMSEKATEDLYDLRNNEYPDFLSLLKDIDKNTCVNSRQMKILIELDFFEEFGDTNTLKKQYELFDAIGNIQQISKDNLDKYGVTQETIQPCVLKETEKQYAVDTEKLLQIAMSSVNVPQRSLREKLNAQREHLGYIDVADRQYAGLAVVIELNTKYAPKCKMYSLKNGTIIDCKINKRIFNKNKLEEGDIIRVQRTEEKPRLRKDENDNWVPIPDTSELWIEKYSIDRYI